MHRVRYVSGLVHVDVKIDWGHRLVYLPGPQRVMIGIPGPFTQSSFVGIEDMINPIRRLHGKTRQVDVEYLYP